MNQREKLTSTYTLTIRQEYQELIPLVAKMNGWQYAGDHEDQDFDLNRKIDAMEFLRIFIGDFIKERVNYLIRNSLIGYYGASQVALIEQAMLDYEGSAETQTEWSKVE